MSSPLKRKIVDYIPVSPNEKEYKKMKYLRIGFEPTYHRYYDQYGYDQKGFDCDGLDKYGYNKYGYNKEGYDINGFDINGYDKDGISKDSIVSSGSLDQLKEVLDNDEFTRDPTAQ